MRIRNHRLKAFYLQTLRFLRLIRYPNLLIIVFSQYFVAIFLIGPSSEYLYYLKNIYLFLLSLSTVSIASAGYIINDYYDIKIDIINKPRRVVVGKFLKRRQAMILHSILNFIGIGLGLILGLKIGVIVTFCAFWLWLYSNQLKRLPFVGNLSVAILTGLSISIVGFFFGRNMLLVNFYALFAFFISLIREIIKDMEDMRGDQEFDCKTLPIVWGIRKVKIFIYSIMVFFASVIFLISGAINNTSLYYYFIGMMVPYIFLIYKLNQADKRRDFKFLSNLCKGIMLAGVLSMVFI
ncbi:MAG TPA: geranylgeranylglycerol-phosphate geranylgeranyltransferase [Cytophagales bacterium]|nr:geranylgeranylglycerol-phosphate geranylgeranyltransferase [Cytophagales bacterium]